MAYWYFAFEFYGGPLPDGKGGSLGGKSEIEKVDLYLIDLIYLSVY